MRGFPVRLPANESAFVEQELDKAEKQGMYTKGSSPRGSWAFATKHSTVRNRRSRDLWSRANPKRSPWPDPKRAAHQVDHPSKTESARW